MGNREKQKDDSRQESASKPAPGAAVGVSHQPAKGQITLPKPIRQALGVDAGGKLAFDLRGSEVVVTRVDAEHEDPAIGAFLSILARDIEAGRNVRGLPEDLARAMLEHTGHGASLGDEIDGDVAL